MDEILSMDELHSIQLELMTAFDEYCKKNGYRYYLAYGTLLGAVRHKGFIPWDDDVDIVMPRPDYEKLIKADKISDTVVIISNQNSHGYYHPFTYCNISDTRTVMEEHQMKKPTGKGVFLDIFPLDGLPENEKQILHHCKKIRILRKILCYTHMKRPPLNNIRGIIKAILCWFAAFLDPNKIIQKIDRLAKTYDYDSSSYVGNVVFSLLNHKKVAVKKIYYGNSLKLSFEGKMFEVPNNYDELLTHWYGDYMTPPPKSEQMGHHNIAYKWK